MSSTFAQIDVHRLSDGVSPPEVDRLLDPLVAQCRLDIPGLIHLVCGAPDHGAFAGRALALDTIERLARATRLEEMEPS